MEIIFKDRNIVEINDARIIFRNFSGVGSKFNREGERNFCVVIPNQELADELMNDTNEYGVGWNVKIKESREEGDDPFMFLKVKVNMDGGRKPTIYLRSGSAMRKLNEDTIDCLDDIDIRKVDMDIRPYDDMFNDKPFRSAYLQSICVTQEVDRFMERYADEENPEE